MCVIKLLVFKIEPKCEGLELLLLFFLRIVDLSMVLLALSTEKPKWICRHRFSVFGLVVHLIRLTNIDQSHKLLQDRRRTTSKIQFIPNRKGIYFWKRGWPIQRALENFWWRSSREVAVDENCSRFFYIQPRSYTHHPIQCILATSEFIVTLTHINMCVVFGRC